MTQSLDGLLDKIKAESGVTDPATAALIARITLNAVAVGARMAAGENVAEQLDNLKAQKSNLEAKFLRVVATNVTSYLQEAILKGITLALLA